MIFGHYVPKLAGLPVSAVPAFNCVKIVGHTGWFYIEIGVMCCDSKLTYPFETAPHLLLPKSSHFPRYLLHLPLAQTDKTKAPTKHLYRRPTRDKSSVRDGLNHNRVNDHPSIVECSPSEHISHCLHPPRSLRLIRGHDTSTTTTMTEENWVHYHDGGIPGRRRVLTGAAAKSTFSELPKIDFRRIYSDDLADRQQLAQEVGAACRDIGFFYAVNHGVDESLLNDTFEATRKFFDLPTAVKMEVHNQRTSKFRGYEAFLEGKLDPSTRGDLKEGFLMGEDATDPEQDRPITPSTAEPRNQWPTHPSALFWRPAIYRYYNAMYTFSKRLLRIFALALDLPENAFDAVTTYPMTNVRAVHYPPQESEADVGIGAHTDFCWFTLVCQSHTTQPALEVLNANGVWVPVHPEPHTFVVNIADFLKLVTGGTWQSTVHRVRNMGGEERYSLPFFFSPNEDARISVLEQFRKVGEMYEEFVVGEYFQKRLDIDRTTHVGGKDEKRGMY